MHPGLSVLAAHTSTESTADGGASAGGGSIDAHSAADSSTSTSTTAQGVEIPAVS